MKYKIIFLLLLSYGTTIGQSQLFKSNKVGLSALHDSSVGLTLEACLNSSLTENLSINLRYSSNSLSYKAFGGGIEWRFLKYKKFSASVGLEYSYNKQEYFLPDTGRNYSALEIPLQLEYQINENWSLTGSFIYRPNELNRARVGIFYKF